MIIKHKSTIVTMRGNLQKARKHKWQKSCVVISKHQCFFHQLVKSPLTSCLLSATTQSENTDQISISHCSSRSEGTISHTYAEVEPFFSLFLITPLLLSLSVKLQKRLDAAGVCCGSFHYITYIFFSLAALRKQAQRGIRKHPRR